MERRVDEKCWTYGRNDLKSGYLTQIVQRIEE
jgi:hypothetical protein